MAKDAFHKKKELTQKMSRSVKKKYNKNSYVECGVVWS
jgi:hypothetical protein